MSDRSDTSAPAPPEIQHHEIKHTYEICPAFRKLPHDDPNMQQARLRQQCCPVKMADETRVTRRPDLQISGEIWLDLRRKFLKLPPCPTPYIVQYARHDWTSLPLADRLAS